MNLPHPLDRPHQLKTAQRILQSDKKFIIISAPTGSGKSAYTAFAALEGYRTVVNVKTKSLQAQYQTGYSFTPIFGKGNYKCLQLSHRDELSNKRMEVAADLCDPDEINYTRCKWECPYPLNRKEFISSQAGIMNYSKFLLDRKLFEDFHSDILFLDEAHELSDLTIDFSGIAFSYKGKRLKEYIKPIILNVPQPIALTKGKEWLKELLFNLECSAPLHPSKGGDLYHYKWWQRTKDKVDITLACMDIEPTCWYIEATEKRFLCKPLTSQFHFRRLFEKAPKIVLMSATIQPKDIQALGIDDYEFIKVPNTIPAPMRPVYNLKAPAVTAKMSLQEQKEHARIIANVFNNHPGWNGIIHCPSKVLATQIANYMNNMTSNPIWLPESENGQGTDKAYQDWQKFNNQNEAAICVSWQFMTGVDMPDVAINICARTPYPYFGDNFEKERFNFNPGQARVRVANTIEQQMGRNRRGFTEHYGPGARKYNAICDGKWIRLRSAFQKEFLESVQ